MIDQKSSSCFLREPQVNSLTGLSKSTRWRLERAGRFPRRRRLSTRSVGWLTKEIYDWLLSRKEVKAEESIDERK